MHDDGNSPGGLHLTVRLSGAVPDTMIVEDVAQAGIGCVPLSASYRSAERQTQGFLLGFTSSDEATIEKAILTLQQAVAKRKATLVPVMAFQTTE